MVYYYLNGTLNSRYTSCDIHRNANKAIKSIERSYAYAVIITQQFRYVVIYIIV